MHMRALCRPLANTYAFINIGWRWILANISLVSVAIWFFPDCERIAREHSEVWVVIFPLSALTLAVCCVVAAWMKLDERREQTLRDMGYKEIDVDVEDFTWRGIYPE